MKSRINFQDWVDFKVLQRLGLLFYLNKALQFYFKRFICSVFANFTFGRPQISCMLGPLLSVIQWGNLHKISYTVGQSTQISYTVGQYKTSYTVGQSTQSQLYSGAIYTNQLYSGAIYTKSVIQWGQSTQNQLYSGAI